jgi:hypothetical protein
MPSPEKAEKLIQEHRQPAKQQRIFHLISPHYQENHGYQRTQNKKNKQRRRNISKDRIQISDKLRYHQKERNKTANHIQEQLKNRKNSIRDI